MSSWSSARGRGANPGPGHRVLAPSAPRFRCTRCGGVCHVGRSGFLPAPPVDWTVVLLEPFPDSGTAVPVLDAVCLFPGRTRGLRPAPQDLRNALASLPGPSMTGELRAPSRRYRADRRGETLTVQEFAQFADVITGARCAAKTVETKVQPGTVLRWVFADGLGRCRSCRKRSGLT